MCWRGTDAGAYSLGFPIPLPRLGRHRNRLSDLCRTVPFHSHSRQYRRHHSRTPSIYHFLPGRLQGRPPVGRFIGDISHPVAVGRNSILVDVRLHGRWLHDRYRFRISSRRHDPERNLLLAIAIEIGERLSIRRPSREMIVIQNTVRNGNPGYCSSPTRRKRS